MIHVLNVWETANALCVTTGSPNNGESNHIQCKSCSWTYSYTFCPPIGGHWLFFATRSSASSCGTTALLLNCLTLRKFELWTINHLSKYIQFTFQCCSGCHDIKWMLKFRFCLKQTATLSGGCTLTDGLATLMMCKLAQVGH